MKANYMWDSLSEGQGAVLAAIVTLFAAIASVTIGSVFYRGKVKSLEDAIKDSEEKIEDYVNRLDASFKEFEEQTSKQLSALIKQLSTVSAIVSEQETSESTLPQTTQTPLNTPTTFVAPTAQINFRDQMKANWTVVRDAIEAIASDENIDGRTLAALGRIDRRQYWALVEALDNRKMLKNKGDLYRQAVELWQKYRANRVTPTSQDIERMNEIVNELKL